MTDTGPGPRQHDYIASGGLAGRCKRCAAWRWEHVRTYATAMNPGGFLRPGARSRVSPAIPEPLS